MEPSQTGVPVLLGVDGGQTATRAVAVSMAGDVVGTVTGPGLIHPLAEGGAEHLESVLRHVAGEIAPHQVAAAYLALTGVEGPDSPSHPVAEAVARRVWPSAALEVDNDGMAAWAGGTAGRPGVVAMAGTGSVVIAVNEDGAHVRTGGWGPVLGDAGGGWSIGLAALRNTLRRWDANQDPSELDRALLVRLGITSIGGIPPAVMSGDISRLDIARLAEIVGAGAADLPEAADILSDGAIDFAQDVAAAMSRLTWRELPVRVVPVGSVYRAGAAYLGPLERALASRSTIRFEMRPPVLSGLGGAVLLAHRLIGPPDEAFVRRLEASPLALRGGDV